MKPRTLRLAALALTLTGGASFGHGVWILAKAELAQVLLERAWHKTLAGERAVRPWSWADTWPVARLEAPAHGADAIVLAGSSGAVIAFGPGHLDGSAPPGAPGNTVVAGHRDTHFAFLRHLAPGDVLLLETADGAVQRYAVESARVVDERDVNPLQPTDGDVLTLVTCYPFEALAPGGPLRYVVRAGRSARRQNVADRRRDALVKRFCGCPNLLHPPRTATNPLSYQRLPPRRAA